MLYLSYVMLYLSLTETKPIANENCNMNNREYL